LERWCLKNLFTYDEKNGFTLLDVSTYCDVKLKSNEKPDFEIYCNSYKMKFYIECKYFSSTHYFYNTAELRMRYYQNKNHSMISKEYPVFYLFGVGGKPDNPKYLYLAPFKIIRTISSRTSIQSFYLNKNKYRNFLELFNCQVNN